jgi:hypothetical protein
VSYHLEIMKLILELVGRETKQTEIEVEVEVTVDGTNDREPFVVRTKDGTATRPLRFRRDSNGICRVTAYVLQGRLVDFLKDYEKRKEAVRAAVASFVNTRRNRGQTAFQLGINDDNERITNKEEGMKMAMDKIKALLENGRN